MTTKTSLEQPRAVQLVAAVLMVKPILDVLMMQLTDVHNFNWISWLLMFAAGVSLLIRHKTAWIFSITLSLGFVISSILNFLHDLDSTDTLMNFAMGADCLLVLLVVGTVAFYFRYPYLDRRQNWLSPTADRFVVGIAAKLAGATTQTVDLSYAGACLMATSQMDFKVGDYVTLEVDEINDLECQVEIISIDAEYVRVRFEKLSDQQENILKQWLHSQNLQRT